MGLWWSQHTRNLFWNKLNREWNSWKRTEQMHGGVDGFKDPHILFYETNKVTVFTVMSQKWQVLSVCHLHTTSCHMEVMRAPQNWITATVLLWNCSHSWLCPTPESTMLSWLPNKMTLQGKWDAPEGVEAVSFYFKLTWPINIFQSFWCIENWR